MNLLHFRPGLNRLRKRRIADYMNLSSDKLPNGSKQTYDRDRPPHTNAEIRILEQESTKIPRRRHKGRWSRDYRRDYIKLI
jgi:hypothetical protein